jgi:hypothetical protein
MYVRPSLPPCHVGHAQLNPSVTCVPEPSDLSYRGQLGEGTEGPRGRGQGGSSLEGTGKGRLWRKGSRKEVNRGAQRVNASLSHLSCL